MNIEAQEYVRRSYAGYLEEALGNKKLQQPFLLALWQEKYK